MSRFQDLRALAVLGLVVAIVPLAATRAIAKTESLPLLIEDAKILGVDFIHQTGSIGRLLLPEIMGPGVALFDYDRDGDLDLYLVQSGELLANKEAQELLPNTQRSLGDRLFRNDLGVKPDGSRALRFTEVTAETKLHARGYGQGVAIADVNGDGWQDVYLTNVGANELWLNEEGLFRKVMSGAEDPRWSTSASFFDGDNDGDLDLFVTNYAVWSVKTAVTCFATSSRRDYCGPQSYPPEADGYYLNRGDGTFELVNEPRFAAAPGSGLGVVALDVNGDGRMDLFVANDGMANRLWLNGARGWMDDGLLSGVAVNRDGVPEASMGIAVGDVDGDGDADLFLSHLDGETDTLLLNQGDGLFADRTVASGLGSMALAQTSFGAALVDLDADGLLDLAIASGAVRLERGSGIGGVSGLGQANFILRNNGVGAKGLPSFTKWPKEAAPAMAQKLVSRGLVYGDLDNDGDPDLVVTNGGGPVQIFINQTNPAQWVGLELSRDGLSSGDEHGQHGAPLLGWQVELRRAEVLIQSMIVRVDGSYLSSSDPRVLLPLARMGDTVEIRSALRGARASGEGASGEGDSKKGENAVVVLPVLEEMIGRYTPWRPLTLPP